MISYQIKKFRVLSILWAAWTLQILFWNTLLSQNLKTRMKLHHLKERLTLTFLINSLFVLKEVSQIPAADAWRGMVWFRAFGFLSMFGEKMYSHGHTVIFPFPLNLIILLLAQIFVVSNSLSTLSLLPIFYSFANCLGFPKHCQKSQSPCSVTSLS